MGDKNLDTFGWYFRETASVGRDSHVIWGQREIQKKHSTLTTLKPQRKYILENLDLIQDVRTNLTTN